MTRTAPAFGRCPLSLGADATGEADVRRSHGAGVLHHRRNHGNITNADNAYNRQAERALSSFDVPQRLTVSATWELPVGRGRHFARQYVALARSGQRQRHLTFDTFQAGFPLSFSLAPSGANSSRPNAIGNLPKASTELSLITFCGTTLTPLPLNRRTSPTATPVRSIGTVRSPGMNNIDATLHKTFNVLEKAERSNFARRCLTFRTIPSSAVQTHSYWERSVWPGVQPGELEPPNGVRLKSTVLAHMEVNVLVVVGSGRADDDGRVGAIRRVCLASWRRRRKGPTSLRRW